MYRLLQCLLAVVVVLFGPGVIKAADHRDAPTLSNSAAVGSRDINDVYIFQSPANAKFTVLVMTVNPFAGVLSPTTFEQGVLYDFCIDNDGDAVEDIVYRYRFFDLPLPDTQLFILQRLNMDTVEGRLGVGPELSVGFTGASATIDNGGGTIVDLFDDPFFFDLNGFNNGFQFTGDNFFEGANVSAIVLNLPSVRLTGRSSSIGVWCRTLSPGPLGVGVGGVQFDRMGRPAINTALIPKTRKDEFNVGQPVNDPRDFRANVITKLKALGNTAADARAIAGVLLPDILTFDTASSDGFLNGRRLQDDVIDTELSLLSAGAITTDGVDRNDRRFRDTFPYLAPAQ